MQSRQKKIYLYLTKLGMELYRIVLHCTLLFLILVHLTSWYLQYRNINTASACTLPTHQVCNTTSSDTAQTMTIMTVESQTTKTVSDCKDISRLSRQLCLDKTFAKLSRRIENGKTVTTNKKYRIKKTMNLSMCLDSRTNTKRRIFFGHVR